MHMGCQRHAPAALPPAKSYGTEGWVGPRAGLNGYGDEEIKCPHRGSKPEPFCL